MLGISVLLPNFAKMAISSLKFCVSGTNCFNKKKIFLQAKI